MLIALSSQLKVDLRVALKVENEPAGCPPDDRGLWRSRMSHKRLTCMAMARSALTGLISGIARAVTAWILSQISS